jgi:MEMO1 family protein
MPLTSGAEGQKMDRQPAVAGQFYPGNPAELKKMVMEMLSKSASKGDKSGKRGTVRALILPHAGYVFSGLVAAAGFDQLDPDASYDDIFIIAASHKAGFDGAVAYYPGDFITPLGKVEVDTALCRELTEKGGAFLDRPSGHEGDHVIEVELPFLQVYMKKKFRIVPILIGTEDRDVCRKIALVLKPYFTPKNLFIISSDFSHYPDYDDAKKTDKTTLEAILKNSPDALILSVETGMEKGIRNLVTCACGYNSILTLLYMTAGDPSISINPVRYMNSGDIAGDRSRVVGYHAIAFTAGGKAGR